MITINRLLLYILKHNTVLSIKQKIRQLSKIIFNPIYEIKCFIHETFSPQNIGFHIKYWHESAKPGQAKVKEFIKSSETAQEQSK